MNVSRNWIIAVGLGCSVFCESMAYTYMQQEGQTYFYSSSLLYFLAGIIICFLPLFSVKEIGVDTLQRKGIRKFLPIVFLGFLVFLLIYNVCLLEDLYQRVPLSLSLADMLPVIKLACKRLLHSQPVYAPTPEIFPGSVNAYFPMMWLPYLPSEVFGYDMRWTTVAMMFASIFISARPIFRASKGLPIIPVLITGGSLFLVLNFFLFHGCAFWAMTEEGVVTGFYVLLGYALLCENYYLIGLAMSLCLLSRYALIPWIPTYFAFVFFTKSKTDFKKLFFTFSGLVLLIFVIPFFIWNPLYFLGLPGVQSAHIDVFWKQLGLDTNQYMNVGLYKFFKHDNAWLMVKIELIASFISPVFFIFMARKLQKKCPFDNKYIAFGSLKLSLVFFYNFIPTPYMYLFFPVTLISYVVLFDFISTQVIYEAA